MNVTEMVKMVQKQEDDYKNSFKGQLYEMATGITGMGAIYLGGLLLNELYNMTEDEAGDFFTDLVTIVISNPASADLNVYICVLANYSKILSMLNGNSFASFSKSSGMPIELIKWFLSAEMSGESLPPEIDARVKIAKKKLGIEK